MVPPTRLDPHFLFNPWMQWHERVDPQRAREQWELLVRLIEEAGGRVIIRETAPEEATGAVTFTADGALVYAEDKAIILANDGPRGVLEPGCFRRWLEALGYCVEGTPYRIDGGNVVAGGPGIWLIGSKPGSSGQGERYLGKLLRRLAGAECFLVPLVDDRFLHLDTAMANLGGRGVLYYPGAFPDEGASLVALPWLKDRPILQVSREDAQRYACNTVQVGETVITGPISRRLQEQILDLGLRVVTADLSELYKAGGGAKCLTLPLTPPRWRERSDEHEKAAGTSY